MQMMIVLQNAPAPPFNLTSPSLLWAVISGTAALCLSILNFYFQHLRGAKIRAFVWNVEHMILAGETRTSGQFAFTNEGNKTTVVTRVFVKLSTGESYDLHQNLSGQKGIPLALPPQETEYRELARQWKEPVKSGTTFEFQFETYKGDIGTVERRKLLRVN